MIAILKKKKIWVAVTIISFVFISFAFIAGGIDKAWADEQKPVKLILAHEVPTTHYKHQIIMKYVKMVEERSKGRIKFEIYPGAQLYNEREAMMALGTGSVHMVWPVTVLLEQVNEAFGVVNLPFALDDELMLKKPFRLGLQELLTGLATSKKFKVMGMVRSAGNFFCFAKKDVKTLEEMKGLKIRIVGGLIMLDWLKELGISPISMPSSEMTTALTQGAIDGIQTSPNGWAEMIGPAARFGLETRNLFIGTLVVLIDQKIWEGLSPDLQRILQESLDEFCEDQWQLSINDDKERMDRVRQKIKAKINTLDSKELALWVNKTRPSTERFKKKFPDCYRDFVNLYVKHGRQYPPQF